MNRILINSAAAINIAAAALIYIACSGDDGAAGPAGSGCRSQSSTTTPGGIDIVCDGQPTLTLPPGSGATGTCVITPIGATGSFNALCDGQNYVIGGSQGGGQGGCAITEDGPNSEYIVFTCAGSAPARMAKAWCEVFIDATNPSLGTVSTPYNPNLNACSGNQLSEHVCGNEPWNKNTHFCATNVRGKDTLFVYCGTSATGESIEYNVLTSFCLLPGDDPDNNIGPGGTDANKLPVERSIKPLCGTTKEAYAYSQFCQTRATGEAVTELCALTSGEYTTFSEFEICTAGKLYGNCNGAAYEPSTHFCQDGKAAKQLCVNNSTKEKLQYTTSQFCASGDFLFNGAYVQEDQVYDLCGPVPAAGAADTSSYDPSKVFCLTVNSVATKVPLCGNNDPATGKNGKYLATEFCQVTSGGLTGAPNEADRSARASLGTILNRCGAITAAGRGAYGPDDYCNVANQVKGKENCNGGSAGNKYNPETEFCGVSYSVALSSTPATATDYKYVYPTCKPRAAAGSNINPVTATKPYGVDTLVCDTRNSKLYRIATLGTGGSATRWLLENVNFGGSDGGTGLCYGGNATSCDTYGRLYNYNQADQACKGIGSYGYADPTKKEIGNWTIPATTDWTALLAIAGVSNTDNLKKPGSTIWTPPAGGTDPLKFAALPGGRGTYTPTAGNQYQQSGISAYWWSTTAVSALPNSHVQGPAITFNSSTFEEIVTNQTTGGLSPQYFEANKASDFLSVRCVSVTSKNDGIEATSGGGTTCATTASLCTTRTACANASHTWTPANVKCDGTQQAASAPCSGTVTQDASDDETNGSCS